MLNYHFEFSLGGAVVSPEEGVIRGVSIITAGVQAKGHDLEVDGKTLSQMQACAKAKGKVPVKWNHKTGADATNGYLNNFRIEDNKLKADWHLLKSHERYAQAMEMAEVMPEVTGLSASFAGLSELKDGTKVYEADAETQHQYIKKGGERLPVPPNTKKFARCTDLVSVDLVSSPAANPGGLFEAGVDMREKGMSENATQHGAAAAKEFSLADVMAGIQQLNAGFQQLAQRTAQLEEFANDLSTAGHELEAEEEAAGHHQFSSMEDAVRHLEARLEQIGDEREQAENEHAFSVLEEKMNSLLSLNAQLTAENMAMATVVHEFQAHTGAKVEFSAGADGGYEPKLTLLEEGQSAPRTAYEARIQELQRGGKEESEAILFAIKEDRPRYIKHLQETGVFVRNL